MAQKPPLKLTISPHPLAPVFNRPDGNKVLGQLLNEVEGSHLTMTDPMKDLLRQACLVNLWFFLKIAAGYSGPFDLLDDDLHIDMCNYRQILLKPGSRGGMFIPRGHFKSTIVTEGGTGWEILRNPNIRIRITHFVDEIAKDFMATVKEMFWSNDFIRCLFPEYCPDSEADFNKTRLIFPNRTRSYREPTVCFGSVGGSSQGIHVDLHVIDDMIGLSALSAMRQANATMQQIKNWFWSSEKPILVPSTNSRVIVVGTRYAIDDVYDEIIAKAKSNYGYPIKNFFPAEDGRWDIYYRKAIEDGNIIFPTGFTQTEYNELAKDDWWTWVTQYLNDPAEAGLAEFTQYNLKSAQTTFEGNEWFIIYKEEGTNEIKTEPLSDYDVVAAGDPAATDRYVSAKTSRSTIVVLATRWDGKKFIIAVYADFVEPNTFFDWMFDAYEKFRDYLRAFYLEANAGFKVLGPIIEKEMERRNTWFSLQPFASIGEKIARIRSDLDVEFANKAIYVVDEYKDAVYEETRAFPQSNKKDILDALSMAVRNSIPPISPEDKRALRLRQIEQKRRHLGAAGY